MNNTSSIFRKLLISHFLLNITNFLCNILNGFVAGNFIDSIAVSFNSLIVPYNRLLLAFGYLYATGSEILCGKYMGSGDKKSINKVFTISIILGSLFGILATLVTLSFPNKVVTILGASDSINEYAAIYIKAYAAGNIAYILIPIFSSFLHIEDEGNQVIKSVILMTVAYCLCSYCFIEIFDLDYFGFGLATSISNILSLIYLFIRIYINRNQIFFEKIKFDPFIFLEIHKLGLLSCLSNFLLSQRGLIFNKVLVETGGVTALSAYSILSSVLVIIDSFVLAVIQTFSLISSVYIGERNREELLNTFNYYKKHVIPILVLIIAIYYIFIKQACSLFSNDIDAINLACHAIRVYLPSTIIELFVNIILNIYIIFDHKVFSNILNVLHSCVIHSTFSLFTKSSLSYDAVFYGYVFTEILSLIIICIYAFIQNKKLFITFEDFLLLDDTMDNNNKLNLTVDNYSHVINISQKVIDYCLSNGISKKVANKCGLCVEEIATNVFEHGFTKKEVKNKRVDIFVIVEENEVSIRIRDNSISFNPLDRSLVFNPKDSCKNIGIRLISKLAKQFTYSSIFGLNNTTIKISNI